MKKLAFFLIVINGIIVQIYSSEVYQFYAKTSTELQIDGSKLDDVIELSLIYIQNGFIGPIITISGNTSLSIVVKDNYIVGGYSSNLKNFTAQNQSHLQIKIFKRSVRIILNNQVHKFRDYLGKMKKISFGPFKSKKNTHHMTCIRDIQLNNVSLYLNKDRHDQCDMMSKCPPSSIFNGTDCQCQFDYVFIDGICVDKKCNSNSCDKGICERRVDSFTNICKCNESFVGHKCCPLNYCKNGGLCVRNNKNEISCQCKFNFTGPNCECGPNYCNNKAECLKVTGKLKCTCKKGFYGDRCQYKDNCANNGVAKMDYRSQKLICKCINGFNGSRCLCPKNPCNGNGKCIEDINSNSYKCECFMNFHGPKCSIWTNFCKNNGTFSTYSNQCLCSHSYIGYQCNCHYDFCKNGGTCIAKEGYTNRICRCTPGYFGSRCTKIPELCFNGGVLMKRRYPQETVCQCVGRSRGPHCACLPDKCLNNGLCISNNISQVSCVCSRGFYGDICQFKSSNWIITLIGSTILFLSGCLGGIIAVCSWKIKRSTRNNESYMLKSNENGINRKLPHMHHYFTSSSSDDLPTIARRTLTQSRSDDTKNTVKSNADGEKKTTERLTFEDLREKFRSYGMGHLLRKENTIEEDQDEDSSKTTAKQSTTSKKSTISKKSTTSKKTPVPKQIFRKNPLDDLSKKSINTERLRQNQQTQNVIKQPSVNTQPIRKPAKRGFRYPRPKWTALKKITETSSALTRSSSVQSRNMNRYRDAYSQDSLREIESLRSIGSPRHTLSINIPNKDRSQPKSNMLTKSLIQ